MGPYRLLKGAGRAVALLVTMASLPVLARSGLHATFLDEAGDAVAVSWLSTSAVPASVSYGLEATRLEKCVEATREACGAAFARHARLTGLKPGTRYYYQCREVGGDPSALTGSFRTAAAPDQPVTFAVLGDIQVKGPDARWRYAAQWLAARKLDFCLSLGDQVDKGLQLDQWKALFEDGSPLFESTVFMPLVGNHDEYFEVNAVPLNPELYFRLFLLPENGYRSFTGQWYAFRAGATAFTVLNAYPVREGVPCDVREVPEQKAWLDATLGKQPGKSWKFVAFHPPVFSTGPHGGDTSFLDGLWGRMLERHRVAVVFNGHTHAFEITRPLREGKAVADGRGILYYNGAGISFSSPATGDARSYFWQKSEREPLALIVSVTPEKLVLRTWNMVENAVVHEEVVERRKASASPAPVDAEMPPAESP